MCLFCRLIIGYIDIFFKHGILRQRRYFCLYGNSYKCYYLVYWNRRCYHNHSYYQEASKSFSFLILFHIYLQGIEEVHKASAIFPTALESINYSEIPIAVIAVIADHMQISLDEVAQEYAKDAAQRKVVVLQTFRKDPVTDRFIESFPSKFIQHGYVGEELLQS